MKFHLPLNLRRALLALVTASSFSALPLTSYATENIAYENPASVTVSEDLDFTGEVKEVTNKVHYRICLNSSDLSLLPQDSQKNQHSIIFDLGTAGVHARAFKMSGSDLEIGFMNQVSFSNYIYQGDDGKSFEIQNAGGISYGGAIFAVDGSLLHFHDNTTLSFNSNDVFSPMGGAIYLENSDLLIADNEHVLFHQNGADIAYSGSSVSGWKGGGAIGVSALRGATSHTVSIEDNGVVTFSENVNQGNGGAISSSNGIETAGEHLELYFTGNDNVSFSSNQATYGTGGAISWDGGRYATLVFRENAKISFSKNEASNAGGALYSPCITEFSNNGDISFTQNYATGGGGAFYNSGCPATFSKNRSLTFSGNTSGAEGGAIHAGGTCPLRFETNGSLVFLNNQAKKGGAIRASVLTILNTTSPLEFSGNKATNGDGGAILMAEDNYEAGLYIGQHGSVIFSGNSASKSRGAIYIEDTATFLSDNQSLLFSENSAGMDGGAIATGSSCRTLNFNNNQQLLFQNNTATKNGGAICVKSLSIAGNGTVAFTNNNAGTSGGAISAQSVSIVNNESVEFRGNYVKQYDENGNLTGTVLNSVHAGDLELSTQAEGGTITFYDPITNVSTGSLDLNYYKDSDGNDVTGAGDIVFSGLHAEEDLTAVFRTLGLGTTGETFQSCLETSLTSTIRASNKDEGVTLHGGTLRVSDDAILKIANSSYSGGNYLAKNGTLTELSNGGSLNIDRDATFESDANLRISQAAMTAGRDFKSSGYAFLREGTLNIGRDAVLNGGGWIELQHGSSVTAGGSVKVQNESNVTFTGNGNTLSATGGIVFEEGSFLDQYGGTGSTLQAPSVSMKGTELLLAPQNDGYALTVDGNLSLAGSSIYITSKGLQDSSSADGFDLKGIDVTGTLAVSGAATINLNSAFENRKGVLTLFRVNADSDFSGTVEDWTCQLWKEGTYDAATNSWGEDTFTPLKNGELTAAYLTDGKWGILLKLGGGDSPTPGDEDIYVPYGTNEAISSLDKKVHLLGGTLDVTGLPQDTPLTNQVLVEGTDGLLVMNGGQTLVLTGNLTGKNKIGYDIDGVDGGSAGGVAIGSSGGSLNSGAVDLGGETYNIASLNVRGGMAGIEETASLGHDGTSIIVGSSSGRGETSAALINDGSIRGNSLTVNSDGSVTNNNILNVADITLNSQSALANTGNLTAEEITVAEGALLRNAGSLEGNITLLGNMSNSGQTTGMILVQQGASLSGGGIFDSVTVRQGGRLNIQGAASFNGLTLEEGSGMAFSVNGTTPAGARMSAEETYSHATVGNLSLTGTPTIEVHIGSGLIASGAESFTLNLLQAAEIAGDAALNQQLLLTGETGLLENGGVLDWNPETGLLTFSGKLNTAAASGLAGQDAALLADTLWSSVSSVASFARTANEQGRIAGVRSSRLWGAGLGYFTSMSSEGTLSGFSYKGGGYAVGADVAASKNAVVGAAFGQMFGTHRSGNSLLSDKQRSFMFALYGNVHQELARGQELNLSGYFSYGSVDHTARTHVGGSRQTPGRARWDDNVYAFGLLADWNVRTGDTFTVAPFTGITCMYGSQGPIEETFDGGSRSFGNGGLQSWSIPVGVTLKSVCGLGNGQALLPELSVAYVGDIARRNPYTRTWAAGQSVTGRGHAPGRHALMTRAGLGWQINRNWQAGAWYTLEVRSGQTNQSVNLNASYSF